MIYGIGTDIVAIPRIEKLLERHGESALHKLLMPSEIEVCKVQKAPARYVAKRFAAKEALSKALGTGLRAPVLLTHIAVTNDALGKPEFSFSPPLRDYLASRGLLRVHLSISDEKDVAVAFVLVEQL